MYAVVRFQEFFIYFGGVADTTDVFRIAKFDSVTRKWSNLGNMVTARSKHGVDFDGTYFLVAGDYKNRKTEKCTLTGSTMTCQQQGPNLNN